ncbi:MAG: 2Fe-2S iron-sulfur cluster binding domain-containing protein [Pseudomonadales bacterium]|nr:2Fe-2S iron-sulfur cluster binding domain-containing protein [Pseudomonadales bacterium]
MEVSPTEICYQGSKYPHKLGASVLDTLLENGVEIPYSCRAGVCQSCVMRCDTGELPANCQTGLKDTLCSQGYFLACQCKPEEKLSVTLPNDLGMFGHATVVEKTLLSANICGLKLLSFLPLDYHAGQFINLRNAEGCIRSYSLASLPAQQEYLELHIRRHPDGEMSSWLFDEIQPGDLLDLQGPNGQCFYISDNPEQTLLLIGTGTGLAPLLGIVRDALYSGHTGPIYLYHGSGSLEGLYHQEILEQLAKRHENFSYQQCLSAGIGKQPVPLEGLLEKWPGRADEIAFERHIDLNNTQIYLCGAPAMVKAAQRRAFLAGAELALIHADPFLTRAD